MGIARPDEYARELALDFLLEEPAQSTMRVLRFTFKFPDMKAEPKEYAEVVARVTQWAAKMKPWTFVHPGPQAIVAAELTFGNRWRVGVVNRKTRKLLAAFWSDEAQARRMALSQATPEQSIKVLDQTPKKEKETRKLRETLVKAAAVLEQADPVVPGVSPTVYNYEAARAVMGEEALARAVHANESAPTVFVDNQGAGGQLH